MCVSVYMYLIFCILLVHYQWTHGRQHCNSCLNEVHLQNEFIVTKLFKYLIILLIFVGFVIEERFFLPLLLSVIFVFVSWSVLFRETTTDSKIVLYYFILSFIDFFIIPFLFPLHFSMSFPFSFNFCIFKI